MQEIKFGTDGWRAIMGKEFTFENVERVAQAYAGYLNQEKKSKGSSRPKIAIGYDHRKNSPDFAKVFAQVLMANDIEVILANSPAPTPAVSFTIVNEKLSGGVALTASHNPAQYNGVKIKTDYGGSADPEMTHAIENLMDKFPVRKVKESPLLKDFNRGYLAALKKYLRLDVLKKAKFSVLVDSMYGTGDKRIEEILEGSGIKVRTIHSGRNESFGGVNPEPIAKNLKEAIQLMKKGEFDLAIATDGDADRIGVIRPGGEFVSPGTLLSLIMIHFVEDLGRKGSVVTTLSNTALIFKVAQALKLPIHETPVGFKHICEIMRRENVLIGGEESGGIGFQDYLFERDGLLSGLLILEMMAMRGKTFDTILREVENRYGKYFYSRQDIQFPLEYKQKLMNQFTRRPLDQINGCKVIRTQSDDGFKFVLEGESWLLFRFSGTEPLLRIYAESTDSEQANRLVETGKKIAFEQS